MSTLFKRLACAVPLGVLLALGTPAHAQLPPGEAGMAPPVRGNATAFLEMEVDDRDPYVQQSVGVVVRLYYASQLLSGELGLDAPDGASMQRVGQGIAGLHELQRHRVDAVTQPRRGRTVREDVALVAVAARAPRLDADHAIAGVPYANHVGRVDGRPETRPARAALELGPGLEEGKAAEPAAIDPVGLVV